MFKFEISKDNVLVVVIKNEGVTIREWMGDAWSDRPIYLPMNIVWGMLAELTNIHRRYKGKGNFMSSNLRTGKVLHLNSGKFYNPDRGESSSIKFGDFSLYLNIKSGEDTRDDERMGMVHVRKYNKKSKEGHFFNIFFENIPSFVDWMNGILKVKAPAMIQLEARTMLK